ncbi:hypothetical protein [Gemella sp. zg-570]|uniref:hypothetical protein n=1 Tax=Gemella sp. zg-570 TaxID=2840371 RepID=UPI00209B5C3E|nr:hypothetical protein [Gemella sp. zg-570]
MLSASIASFDACFSTSILPIASAFSFSSSTFVLPFSFGCVIAFVSGAALMLASLLL